MKLHRQVIARGLKVLVILEGRDTAGKDGTIKRIAEHLSPREVRVVAPGKPSNREETEWYFQRFVPQLPAAQEIVLFNRSWYNRAGVEYGHEVLYAGASARSSWRAAPRFERMLVRSGHPSPQVLSGHQPRRAGAPAARAAPATRSSNGRSAPVDEAAQKHWRDYSRARDRMLLRTHSRRRRGSWCGPMTRSRRDST